MAKIKIHSKKEGFQKKKVNIITRYLSKGIEKNCEKHSFYSGLNILKKKPNL